MTHDEVIKRLGSMSNLESVAGMGRFGIETSRALGISVPKPRALASDKVQARLRR